MTERNESADQAQDAIRRLKQKLTLADERIRGLEAELAQVKGDVHKDALELGCPKCGEWTNRTHWTIRPGDSLKARAEKAEARVAELERWKAAVATALPHTQKAMLLEAIREE